MTYKPSPYIEPLILPPQVDPSMSDRGEFRLCFSIPRYQIQTPQTQQVRFKLWGEQFNRFTSFGIDVVFQIKCSNANFSTYLRDMKILKAELVDCRNGSLVGTVLVNLLLFVNPAPMVSETDCPFLPVKETFDIVKHNMLKTKLGQIQISMESRFDLRRNDETVKEFANPESKYKSNLRMLSPEDCEPYTGFQSVSFKRQSKTLIQCVNSNHKQGHSPSPVGMQPAHIQTPTGNYSPQPKTRQPQVYKGNGNNNQHHQSAYLLHYQPINVQANVAKLRMETNELLNTTTNSTRVQHPKQWHIRIIKAVMASSESLSLVLEYPRRVGYQGFKTISMEVPACGSNKQQVRYNSCFCILDNKDMQGKYIKFWFKNRRKDQIGYAQQIMDDMVQNDEMVIPVRNKNQKQIGRIYLQVRSAQQDFTKSNEVQNRVEFIGQNQFESKNGVQKVSIQLMILISIIRSVILNQQTGFNLYYKIVFRFQKENYETAMLKKMIWNYRLAMCINLNTPVENPFILFELWGEGATSRLLGVGKWATHDLLKLVDNGVFGANLQPITLYDSNLPIQSIDTRQNIGYLVLGINVGTPRQISKLIQAVSSSQSRMNQLTKQSPPVSDPSPNSMTEKQLTSSGRDEQNKSKFSLEHQPSSLQSQRYPQINKHSVIQINSLMDTITNFFSAISDSRHRIQLILKEINLNVDLKLNDFQRILQNILEGYEQYWDALAFFYGDGDFVNTLQFLKSFSSFVNFKEILIEQLTSLLLDLNAELFKSNTGLDVLENKLLLYSQFGLVSNSNFKEVFRYYKIPVHLLDKILQTYSSTKQNQLIVSEFMDHLKSCKFNRPLQKLSYNLINLQILIQNSVVEVVTLETETVTLIATTLSTKTLEPKSVCQLLGTLQIDVSIWQALLLIESVKIFFKQDLDFLEGQISGNVMIQWLKSVVAMGGLPKADSFGQITEPDVINLRTERTDTNPDDIANIASLLRQKDKYDYDDLSAPQIKSQQPQVHSNVGLQKVLEGSLLSLQPTKQLVLVPSQGVLTSQRQLHRSQYPVSQRTYISTDPITPRLKYLKYNVVEIKLDIEVAFLTMNLGLLDQNQVLIRKQKGILKFCSPMAFYQYVDMNNIQLYKSKTKGIEITAKCFLRDSETSLKGLISLQDIGKISLSTKKVCLLYNNQMNIVGRVILEIDFVDRQQQLPFIEKQYLLLRILNIQSPSTPCEISFQLNNLPKLHSLQLKKQYQVQMDNFMFKARCELILKCFNQTLQAKFSIENLMLSKPLKLQLPLLKQNGQYNGMILVEMSIKGEEEVVQYKKKEPLIKYTAFVFLDHLTSLSQETRNIDVNISIFNEYSIPSNYEHPLRLSKLNTCIPIGSMLCVQFFKNQLPLIIQLTDLDSKTQFGSGKFKVDLQLTKELYYISTKQICILNRLDIPMQCSIRLLVLQRTQEPKLRNIIQQLRLDRLNSLLNNIDYVNRANVRGVFKDLKISFSQIEYFIQLNLKCQIGLDEIFDKGSLHLRDRNQAEMLLREFRYLDQNNSGHIDEANLKAILQSFSVSKITQVTTVSDLNAHFPTHKASYLSYLRYKFQTSSQHQNPKSDKHPIMYQNPGPEEKDDTVSQAPLTTVTEGQKSFRRICSQINRLHIQLTRAREQQ